MAEHRLDRAQVGAVGQKMRGEGMPQRVRRDRRRREAGLDGEVLDEAEEPVPGQVPGLAPRGKEEARDRLARLARRLFGRIALGQPVGHGRAGGRREGHHPLLAALAPHEQHARIAPRGRDGQADELGHPHAGGVEKLHQAGVAQPVPPRCAGGGQQRLDLGHRQGLGQRLVLARPPDADRRVVRPPAFLEGEAIELLDRREPARPGGPREAFALAGDEIVLDIGLGGVGEMGLAAREERAEIRKVAGIGEPGVMRGVEFGCLGLEEGRDPVGHRLPGGGHVARWRSRCCSARRRAASSSPTARNVARASVRAC